MHGASRCSRARRAMRRGKTLGTRKGKCSKSQFPYLKSSGKFLEGYSYRI